MENIQHRPGAFNLPNKTHKTGGHRSKGIINKSSNGRVNAREMSKKKKLITGRVERRNQAKIARHLKRSEVLEGKRQRGTASSAPFFIAVVSMNEGTLTCDEILNLMTELEDVTVSESQSAHHISITRLKKRFSLLCPAREDTCAVLDAARVADFVMFVASTSAKEPCVVDERGKFLAACLSSQGLPASILCISGLKSVPMKKQVDAKTDLLDQLKQSNINAYADKVFGLDSSLDALQLFRAVGCSRLKRMHMREGRPHLLAESLNFQFDSSSGGLGTLKISGYLRGRPLSVNSLVHIPGFGDFQMSQICTPTDPHPLLTNSGSRGSKKRGGKGQRALRDVDMEVVEEVGLLKPCPEKQESLQAEADVDPMDTEQTFPTDEELAAADAEHQLKTAKVPKGTSQYQAAWILDNPHGALSEGDNGDFSDSDDEDNDDVMDEALKDEEESSSEEEEGVDDDTVTINDDNKNYDLRTDETENSQMLEKFRQARFDRMFPDEVDTPHDIDARIRFQKYQGLKSFKSTAWNPDEDLPADYARIYQFKNFNFMRRQMLSTKTIDADMENKVETGTFIMVNIASVPSEVIDTYGSYGHPLVLFGLLPHEQKMSVLHFLVRRCHDDEAEEEPIESKDPMVVHVGYRRFLANPIYSEHTNGNKHKAERYLVAGVATVASVYAPVMYSPASVLFFKDMPNGEQKLVANGTLLSVDPRRIIVKRVVLAGHPFQINKRTAVVRYMFFTPQDIDWFKPVDLRTRQGLHGHIKMSLGTHGHMKCVFDGQLKSDDSVLMHLFKRVFPKWTYSARVVMFNRVTEDERTKRQKMLFS